MANETSTVRAGIVGVSGYSGMELARILAGHPGFSLALAVSDKWAGDLLGDRLPFGGPSANVRIRPQAEAAAATTMAGLDLVFLCTPAEASLALAGPALEAGARVVDLSGAFRLAADEYPRWYGFAHPRPDLLKLACYAMPEAAASGELRQARLVSNPGCYATASTLATLALLRGGVIAKDGIVIDAKSGMTGAGRKGTEEMSFTELDGDFRAYKVLKHQHTPEIERTLALAGAGALRVTFTPYYLPVRRGILATVYGRLLPGKTGTDAAAAVKAFVADRAFLRATRPEAVRLHAVVGTNRVLMAADADPERGVAVAFAAIDNLVKGAAGQAVQNANLMFGLAETAGLDLLGGTAP
ncbi:MAG TPA: N-acetyl-gamma-glutamyl-phosphate reductase [Polyangia bacterium]|jgi:N-acetyl-gamma-glutamyl-phosphate reductase|nr:N-acetyl-gamma-glutamyl-phosphate reductase [Polyangia bacterium]